VGALVIAGSAVCLSAGCDAQAYLEARGRKAIEHEWSPVAPRCNLDYAVNTLGTGTILYCSPPSTTGGAGPTWLYSGGVAYNITDAARSLTPKITAMADADAEVFRLAGLDRRQFPKQIADMIAEQRKQSAAR
jgi:hypothetical protein